MQIPVCPFPTTTKVCSLLTGSFTGGAGARGGGGGGRRGAGGRGELINANSDVPFSNDHQGLFFAHRLVHRGGGGEPYVKSILAFEPV
jgi:hypothetical protein